jgi:acylglycerol lipase
MNSMESKVDLENGEFLRMIKNRVDNPRAVVVLVHGLCEHAGRYDHVAAALNGFGCSVVRFDNRGHGRSGGRRGYVEDYNVYIEDADRIVTVAKEENSGLPIFMLGHSMGGFITAFYGIKYPERIAGQILSGAAVILSPMVKDLEGLDYNAVALDPIPNALAEVVCRNPDVVKAYVEDPLVLKEFTMKLMGEVLITGARQLMEAMPEYRYPCLILHGGGDLIVPPDASKYFYEHISSQDKELKIYEGLYHEILNEPEKETVLEDIHNWIEKRIQRFSIQSSAF